MGTPSPDWRWPPTCFALCCSLIHVFLQTNNDLGPIRLLPQRTCQNVHVLVACSFLKVVAHNRRTEYQHHRY